MADEAEPRFEPYEGFSPVDLGIYEIAELADSLRRGEPASTEVQVLVENAGDPLRSFAQHYFRYSEGPQELAAVNESEQVGLRLTFYVAGLLVPSYVAIGRVDEAAFIVRRLAAWIVGERFALIPGGGTEGELPDHLLGADGDAGRAFVELRYLLLQPLFTAMVGHWPERNSAGYDYWNDTALDLIAIAEKLHPISPCTLIRAAMMIAFLDQPRLSLVDKAVAALRVRRRSGDDEVLSALEELARAISD
ncbi:hypothetical protein [Stratiformator vulcanicus]|nr:hypothetical protein [Stratiformator vulcanicus]